jgi:hypothetical protein
MDALSAIKVPDDPGPFKRAADRWKPYLDDPETAVVFAGTVLTHLDWTPDNVLVSEHRAWLIDWAWRTLGAAWTDPACWVLRLIASGGHTAQEAERQASRLPAFQAADPAHINLFAAANVRLWDEIAQSNTNAWITKMAQAAKSWASCRQAPLSQRTTRYAPLHRPDCQRAGMEAVMANVCRAVGSGSDAERRKYSFIAKLDATFGTEGT